VTGDGGALVVAAEGLEPTGGGAPKRGNLSVWDAVSYVRVGTFDTAAPAVCCGAFGPAAGPGARTCRRAGMLIC
jgi:hypothetical protein